MFPLDIPPVRFTICAFIGHWSSSCHNMDKVLLQDITRVGSDNRCVETDERYDKNSRKNKHDNHKNGRSNLKS